MTAVAGPLDARTQNTAYTMESSDDMDAEGEDVEEEAAAAGNSPAEEQADEQEDEADGSEAEVEAESEEDNDDDDDPTVRAVRTRKIIKATESDEEVAEPGSDAEESSAAEEDDDSEKSSSEAESVTAEPWQEGGSETADNASVVATRNNCM